MRVRLLRSAKLRYRMRTRKFPLPHAGSRMRKSIRLVLNEVEHRLGHPRRSDYLPVVSDAFFVT